jgi:hypothetical protein
MLISGIVLMLAAILVVAVNEAAARGRLGINGFAGIRFGSLMLSERAWREGHRAARVPMLLVGAALFGGGLVVAPGLLGEDAASVLVIGASVAALALVAVAAFVAARAADRVLVEDARD